MKDAPSVRVEPRLLIVLANIGVVRILRRVSIGVQTKTRHAWDGLQRPRRDIAASGAPEGVQGQGFLGTRMSGAYRTSFSRIALFGALLRRIVIV
jgi:hypothetical protein